MKKKNTQWHPAFYSAIRLELVDNKKDLIYLPEVVLNTKPILIDMLVIRKAPDSVITKDIGRIFRGHNIFEYKSPDAALNIDTFYKVIAYASLYKANASEVDGIKADDITISFVRDRKPVGLFKSLKTYGMEVEKATNGIYTVKSSFPYVIQVIVSKELDPTDHVWLMALTDNLSVKDADRLVKEIGKLSEKDDKDFSDSVLQVAVSKNKLSFEKVKEVSGNMCEALMELMKPEFDAAVDKAVSEAVDKAVSEAVDKAVNEAVDKAVYEANAERDNAIAEASRLRALLEANGIPIPKN